ncbi:MAG: FecCD family ABC transporter permease [Nitrospinota bacterium]
MRNRSLYLGLIISLTPVIMLGSLMFGGVTLPLVDILAFDDEVIRKIILDIRIPRMLLAFLAGGGLALAGLNYQILFQNPLATPFTLGIASGAALGAASVIIFNLSYTVFFVSTVNIGAFVGGLIALLFLYLVAICWNLSSITGLLLAGVALSFIFSSLNTALHYIADYNQVYMIVRWLMGKIVTFGYQDIVIVLFFVTTLFLITLFYSSELDLFLSGETIATTRGVKIKAVRNIILIMTSLTVGAIVSLTGPIAFVGMMAPHIVRLVIGYQTKFLMVGTFFFGGILLVISDIVAKTVIAPAEIPVGIVTSLLGGPFFLWLLKRKVGCYH